MFRPVSFVFFFLQLFQILNGTVLPVLFFSLTHSYYMTWYWCPAVSWVG